MIPFWVKYTKVTFYHILPTKWLGNITHMKEDRIRYLEIAIA